MSNHQKRELLNQLQELRQANKEACKYAIADTVEYLINILLERKTKSNINKIITNI